MSVFSAYAQQIAAATRSLFGLQQKLSRTANQSILNQFEKKQASVNRTVSQPYNVRKSTAAGSSLIRRTRL